MFFLIWVCILQIVFSVVVYLELDFRDKLLCYFLLMDGDIYFICNFFYYNFIEIEYNVNLGYQGLYFSEII